MQANKPLLLMISLAALGLSGLAQAHGDRDTDYRQHRYADRDHNCCHDVIDRRQDNQQHRIREGIRSGELTRHEVRELRRQQDSIARMERRFERDGHLSARERKRLQKALDRASHHIAAAKHDDKRRGGRHKRYDHEPERVSFVHGRAWH